MLAALCAAGLLGANLTVSAQDAGTNAPAKASHAGRLRRLTPEQQAKELGLSEEATAKFKNILQARNAALKELRDDTTISDADKKAKMKDTIESTNAKIKELLTPEQWDKYKTMMPGGQRRGKAPAANTPPPAAATNNN